MLKWTAIPHRSPDVMLNVSSIGRGIEAELHLSFGPTGSIRLRGMKPLDAVMQILRARPEERRILRKCLVELFNAGLLVRDRPTDRLRLTRRAFQAPEARIRLVRADIFERDDYACRYCGSTDDLTIDHVVPRCQGGDDDAWNLAVACRRCNSQKGGRTPEQAGMVLHVLGGAPC